MKDDLEESTEQEKIPWDKRLQDFFGSLTPYLLRVWEKRKKWLIINCIAAIVIVLFMIFIVKPYYDVSIDILPDYGSKSTSVSGLSDLASMAGMSLKAAPTEIYENIIQSESVLAPAIENKYLTDKFKDSVNLIDYFKIIPDEDLPLPLRERDRVVRAIRDFKKTNLKTKVDWTTKILTVSIRLPESKLSAEVANRIVESLDNYIRTQRKSYASDQRVYLEERIKEVCDSLAISEDRLRSLRERTMSSSNIPRLALEDNRLSRNVTLLQGVYMELTHQLELIKLDEIRDTPILNIQELAGDPILKTGPSRTLWSIFLMVVCTTIITLILAFLPKLEKGYSIILDFVHLFRRS